MLRTLTYILASALLVIAATAWPPQGEHYPRALPPDAPLPTIFENVTVWSPPNAYPWKDHTAGGYARSVLLNQNCETGIPTILATSAYQPADGQYLQIFESKDYGVTWKLLSKVDFDGNPKLTGGIIYQPFLFELSESYGSYPAGTVLLTGNRIPEDSSSTNIQLYASRDRGVHWEFVSTVVAAERTKSGDSAGFVFEPFILSHDNQLAVYFSDERDPRWSQKLSHRVSKDLRTWGDTVDDITTPADPKLRPGMITIAQIGNGKWMASFEMGLWHDKKAQYATFYRIADTPFDFLHAPDHQLRTDTGELPNAGPYTVWTPAGGEHGTIVVSASSDSELFLNTENGEPGSWQNVTTGIAAGYSRALKVLPGRGGTVIQVLHGGGYREDFTNITVADFVLPGPEGKGPGALGFPTCLK